MSTSTLEDPWLLLPLDRAIRVDNLCRQLDLLAAEERQQELLPYVDTESPRSQLSGIGAATSTFRSRMTAFFKSAGYVSTAAAAAISASGSNSTVFFECIRSLLRLLLLVRHTRVRAYSSNTPGWPISSRKSDSSWASLHVRGGRLLRHVRVLLS